MYHRNEIEKYTMKMKLKLRHMNVCMKKIIRKKRNVYCV